MNQQEEKWVTEFNEEWKEGLMICFGYENPDSGREKRVIAEQAYFKLKSFIHKTREEAKAEGYGEGLIARSVTQIHNDAIQACVESLQKQEEEIYVECPHSFDCGGCMNKTDKEAVVYNKTIDHIRTSLLSLKK